MVLARMLDRCPVPFGVVTAGAKDADILREGVVDIFINLGKRAFTGRFAFARFMAASQVLNSGSQSDTSI